MNADADYRPSDDLAGPENVLMRTVTPTRKMFVHSAPLVQTAHGTLEGSWTAADGWAPDEDTVRLLRELVKVLQQPDGPDVVHMKWERV